MIKFEIPKSPVGFGILEFATHVLDHSPAYETRAQQRIGYKALDAIEKAVKANESEVLMDDDLAKSWQDAVERTPIPRLFLVVDGKPGDEVPKRFYAHLYEAFENGKSE
jgi:hypothetical protein